MPDQRLLLPFYLVVDVSGSMSGDKIDAANKILPAVTDALAKNPILSDKVRFGLIDFSDDAEVVLPLCDPTTLSTLPHLAIRGGTQYSAAFRMLRSQIETDVAQLKADGFKVHRPAVFFLSDGEPGDDWKADFAALTEYHRESRTGFQWHPVLVPFGVHDADKNTMRQLVHPTSKSKLYMMAEGADAAAAIKAMAEVLISSVLASGNSVGNGGPGLVLPDKSQLAPDIDEDDEWLS